MSMLRRAQKGGDGAFIVTAFSFLGIIATVIFGIVHLTSGNILTGYLELGGSVALALNIVAFRLTKNLQLAHHLFLLVLLGILIMLLTTGGIDRTGIYWFFIFPLGAFFLAGTIQGIMWVGLLYLGTGITLMMTQISRLTLPYSSVEIRQMMVTLLVVTIGMFVYERSRERAERAELQSQLDLQEYVDNMTTLSLKLSPDGTILFANNIVKRITDLGDKAIGANFVSGPWWQGSGSDYEQVQAAFQKAIKGRRVSFDASLRLGNKGLPVHFSLIPIFADVHLSYILAEGRDMSEELKVEQSKSEFVTLASHQLRTPISAIHWYSEMLLSGDVGKLTPEQRDHIQQVYNSTVRLGAIVDAMLMVATLEMREFTFHTELVDINATCKRILADQRALLLGDKKITITEEYDPHLAKISHDPRVINTILNNIISNALKYTPSGGKVAISVKISPDKLALSSKGSIQIAVTDTGYGIPIAQQKNVFVKLFRASNVKEVDTDGTGLGLYIIKELIEQSGGTISFTSHEGRGSTFIIMLPIEGITKTNVKKAKIYHKAEK